MNNPGSIGLYLHVPFCKKKCAYCDFYSQCDYSLTDSYVAALCSEIVLLSGQYGERTVDTVYLGGGTPSSLSERQLVAILEKLFSCFRILPHAEVTLEANPSSLTEEKCRVLKEHGVNRLSMGLQSAQDEELTRLSRLHSYSGFLSAYGMAQRYFDNISLDLMYGLPEGNIDKFRCSLEKAVSLSPKHISLYALKIEEGTPFARQKEELRLPDDDQVADMYLFAWDFLESQGYRAYEISNFARPGFESRHNTRYWRREEYLGLGPAAHSFVDGLRYAQLPDLFAYISSLSQGCPCPRGEESLLDATDVINEEIMLRLRLTEGLNLAYLKEKTGYDMYKASGADIEIFCRAGFIKYSAGILSFTPKGFLVSNSILSELLI